MSLKLKNIKVGARSSRLAVAQIEEVHSFLSKHGIKVKFDHCYYETAGDHDKKTPLTLHLADDFFTDTLDQAVLNQEIDLAIHSAKDLPQNMREDLCIFALTESIDDTDAFVGECRIVDLKDGAIVGTSSPLRQEYVKKINPRVKIKDIRGSIDERLSQVDQGKYDGVIVATVALKRLGLQNRIKEIMPWDSAPLQGQLAVVGRRDDKEMSRLFSQIDVRRHYGCVTLVGAGPGDPELITVKGINALKSTDCIFYDFLIHKDLLRYAEQAQKVYVGKRKGAHALPQEELCKMLRIKAMAGENIVRLKGGDPLIFGRGTDEISYLQSYHINVKVIPGVSSATSIPSSLGIPLTARGISSSVAFVSGHGTALQEKQHKPIFVPNVETIVFLMGLTKLRNIIHSLKAAKWKDSTPVIVISKGTRTDERIVSGTIKDILDKISQTPLEPPALIVVGETVKLGIKKFKKSHSILFTGTNPAQYQMLGDIVHHPMIRISKVKEIAGQIKNVINHLDEFDFILLTSRFAVKFFFDLLDEQNFMFSKFQSKKFVVIGKETARELQSYGIKPVLISELESSEGLLEEMIAKFDLKDKRILFPRSSLANPYLKNELHKLGVQVIEVTVYLNTKPKKKELPPCAIDQVLFTSPSTVKNFLKDYGNIPTHWRILSRGPLTLQTLDEAGYRSEVLIQ